jgi:hypothetical protein
MDHAKYQESLKLKTNDSLRYIMADAYAAMRAMPNGPKAGHYADEINYCGMELNRRVSFASLETGNHGKV